MAKCKTDCIERPLSLIFEKLGRVVGRHPCVFILLVLYVAAALGAGFIFLQEREAHDIEDQFTPVNGPAKLERAIVVENFPQSEEFSQLRLVSDGTYASLIITGLNEENILTEAAFNDIIELDRQVKNIKTGNTFENLCAKTNGKCMSNAILDIIKYNANEIVSSDITYPIHNGVFLGTTIGGVELNAVSSVLTSAKAVRLFYFLDEKKTKENSYWLDGFLKLFSNYTDQKTVSVSYFTSVSRQNEFESSSDSVIPLFSVTYFLAINISVLSCLRLDCVRTKVWVAMFGVVSAGMAVLASFGLLLFCGMPFAMTVASAPFLILGVGVDDMFIMISCWQKTEVDKEVEFRLAETFKEAGVSITITTLTDVLAFYIGLLTPFRSVQSFCMYTSTALLFCYIFNITFFGACLALNGRREKANRHWLTCMTVPEASGNDFSAHISYAFVSSKKSSANEKAADAVNKLGYPIIQGAVSTIAVKTLLGASNWYTNLIKLSVTTLADLDLKGKVPLSGESKDNYIIINLQAALCEWGCEKIINTKSGAADMWQYRTPCEKEVFAQQKRVM
ncbi:patched domain-containing 3-like protein [Labeo rohita]|uniref:Patched domain-containing 3-like protein n=1 Tax=Labeo rohita TaxID=84645 RepID=A0A498MW40_LABRO|nr:patched domain-containing 3-like protein [Labeo rohita]